MRKVLLACMLLILSICSSYAQIKPVTGVVTDDQHKPMEFVTVTILETQKSTTTDMNGRFKINVLNGQNLKFSFVGSIPVTVKVGSGTKDLQIQLKSQYTALNEVVVTGYQTQRKADVIGAVSVVNMDDVKDVPIASPLQALQGRIPGMSITTDGTPGGSARSVLIRGINTLGNNDPLYIIDGQAVDRRLFETMDPNDIQSLQVLKDAASASIYGSRASNGVIIITTKGAKGNKLRVDFNNSSSLQNYASHLQMLNTLQRGQVLWQAAINDGITPVSTQYTFTSHKDAQGNPVLDNVAVNEYLDQTVQGGIKAGNTDWFKEISRPGFLIRDNLSLSSGSDTHSLYLSFSNLVNRGIVKYTDNQQYDFRVNSSINSPNHALKIGENLQVSYSKQTPIGSGQGGTPLDLGILDLPILPVYAEDGSFSGPIGSGFSNRQNALQVAELSRNWKNYYRSVYGNAYLEITPVKNLLFRSVYGLEYTEGQQVVINPTYKAGFLSSTVNSYSNNNTTNVNLTWSNTLNYNLEFGKSRLNLLGGFEYLNFNSSFINGYKEGFLVQTPDYFQFDAGTGVSTLNGNASGYKLLSYFAKTNYSFNSKYLASLTLRSDGSSRFGANNRFGFFPAASVGWRISEESLIKNKLRFISQLMARAGIGTTGNQKIGNAAVFGLFTPAYGVINARRNSGSAYDLNGINTGTLPSGVIATQTANPNLKWESTTEINGGLDFGFFDQKVTGSFDYFFRKTKDILLVPPYLAVLGEGGPMWQNGATMQNKGWEFTLGYNNHVGDFDYRLNANIGSFKDKVTYIPASSLRAYPGNTEKTILGHSLSSIFGYVTDGIYQNQAEVNAGPIQPGKGVGRIRYKDLNGDGVIDQLDQDFLGTTLPDFEYGLNTSISYKNFTLTFFLQGIQGAKQVNTVKNQATLFGAFIGQNNSTLILNAWTPQHTNTDIPAVSNFDSNNETRTSTYQIENSSYLKLRNIQLGYTLPKSFLQKWKMSRAEIYVSATNLFTVKSSQFISPDPENPGTFYPIARTFTLGLSTSF